MYRQVRERFAWKGLQEDVIKHVKECTTCQENKDEDMYMKTRMSTFK
jgi:hypothetical protein